MTVRNISLTLITGSLLLLSSAASAATISFSNTFGPAAVPLGLTAMAPLSQFDTSLGTLTEVKLTLDADAFAGSIAWDNETGTLTDITLGIGAEVTVFTEFGDSVVAIPLQLGSASGVAADNDGAADFVGTDSFLVTGGVGNDVQFATLTGIDMDPYKGLGTFDIDVEGIVKNLLSTVGGYGPISQTAGSTDGTVTVQYTYTVIPEPSTALLLGGGLLVLALRRR